MKTCLPSPLPAPPFTIRNCKVPSTARVFTATRACSVPIEFRCCLTRSPTCNSSLAKLAESMASVAINTRDRIKGLRFGNFRGERRGQYSPTTTPSWRTLVTDMRDPVELEIFKNLYHSIAEEMGAALRRSAFSPNIKERRDYSCAVFDNAGEVIAMGDHMPVHLGSMPMSVRAAIDACEIAPGDIVMLNDPFRGGTHLPDITLVAPVYVRRAPSRSKAHASPDFYVASRAHHADVGGTFAGSMGLCREIYQEGFRIPPVKIMRAGAIEKDVLALLLNNVRTPEEREGDLGAQIAACHTGAERLREVCARYGLARAQHAAQNLLQYSEELMRAFLRELPPGLYCAEDFLDNDGVSERPVRIAVKVCRRVLDPAKAAQPLV